jgi:hypothetical protein
MAGMKKVRSYMRNGKRVSGYTQRDGGWGRGGKRTSSGRPSTKNQQGQSVGRGSRRRVKGTPAQERARGARNANMAKTRAATSGRPGAKGKVSQASPSRKMSSSKTARRKAAASMKPRGNSRDVGLSGSMEPFIDKKRSGGSISTQIALSRHTELTKGKKAKARLDRKFSEASRKKGGRLTKSEAFATAGRSRGAGSGKSTKSTAKVSGGKAGGKGKVSQKKLSTSPRQQRRRARRAAAKKGKR